MRRENGGAGAGRPVAIPTRASGLSPNLAGIAAMIGSSASFVMSDTFAKLAGETLGVGQLVAFRGVLATALILAFARATGALAFWPALLSPFVLARAGLEVGVAFLFLTALTRLPLAEITAILQAVPLLVTALSVLVFRIEVGWRRWTAIVVGFAGVLMVVQPSPAGLEPAALLALGSAVGVALRDLVTRRIDPSVPSMLITLTTTGMVALSGFALAPVSGGWVRPDGATWAYLAAAALAVALGNFLIIVAMRTGEIPVVSPFRYTAMLFAPALGFAVWGHVPNALACLGATLVIGSGLYTIHREAVRARAARRMAALQRQDAGQTGSGAVPS